nr:hypothetical protein [uncultured Acetatifactor sp.]
MNLLKMELKKIDIRPYCVSSLAIGFCLLGLFYIFAWVPSLESGSEASEILFSSYRGIAAVGGAIALMAFSGLAAAMGFCYVVKEYCGSRAILLFGYPVDRKMVVWAKAGLLLSFVTVALTACTYGSFLAFAVTGSMFSLVDNSLHFLDLVIIYRNTLVLAFLADGIALCSIRIGFIKKSNSITVLSAVFLSMLLANLAADMNDHFTVVMGLAVVILSAGLLMMFDMARRVDRMEI